MQGELDCMDGNRQSCDGTLLGCNPVPTCEQMRGAISTAVQGQKTCDDSPVGARKIATCDQVSASIDVAVHGQKSCDNTPIAGRLIPTCEQMNAAIAKMSAIATPVGMIAQAFSNTPFNKYWIHLDGSLINRSGLLVKVFDYLVANLGLVPTAQGFITLPDTRGTVLRSMSKGRFSDVVEIGLGQYQPDATQRVEGTAADITSNSVSIADTNGAFSYTVYPTKFNGPSVPYSTSIQVNYSFSNVRVARTAAEDRGKSTGVNTFMYIGQED